MSDSLDDGNSTNSQNSANRGIDVENSAHDDDAQEAPPPSLAAVLKSCGQSFLKWKTLSRHIGFAVFVVVGLQLSGLTLPARGGVGLFFAILYLEGMINARTMISIDSITLPLIGIGVGLRAWLFADHQGALLGAAGMLIIGRLVAIAGSKVFRGSFLGLGTVKLLTAIGAMWGLHVWQPVLLCITVVYFLFQYYSRSPGRYVASSSLILWPCGLSLYANALELPSLQLPSGAYVVTESETALTLSWIAAVLLAVFVLREITLSLADRRKTRRGRRVDT